MELHPILEASAVPNPELWYVLSAAGDSPSMRVGHTCTHVRDGPSNGKLYFIGGANPSGTFGEVCILDLDTHVWDTLNCPGLRSRYEHSAFVVPSQPTKVYVFGGADQSGGLNDVQVFDTVTGTWNSVVCTGNQPSPRTYHDGPCVEGRLIVYSGGANGSDPVGDRQVYGFDASTNVWSTIRVTGDPPKPRLGHLMVAIGEKIYLYGGMSGSTFYGDLHILDLKKNSWTSVKQKKDQPVPRSGHGGFVSGSDIYIFGGVNASGALDDMHKLDTVTMRWRKVTTVGLPPSNRLDFASCVLRLKVPCLEGIKPKTVKQKQPIKEQRAEDEHSARPESGESARPRDGFAADDSPPADGQTSHLSPVLCVADVAHEGSTEKMLEPTVDEQMAKCKLEETSCDEDEGDTLYQTLELGLIHGGMDTEGEIFEDTLVMLLRILG